MRATGQLTRADCLTLLKPGGNGRVAATMHAVPVIIPVTFTLFGDDIIFRHRHGETLTRAVSGSVIAFEADHLGCDGRAEWEVHVTGVATKLNKPSDSPRFRLSSELVTGWQANPASTCSPGVLPVEVPVTHNCAQPVAPVAGTARAGR